MSQLVVEKLCAVVCIMKGKVAGVTSAATSVSLNSFTSSTPVYAAALSTAVYLYIYFFSLFLMLRSGEKKRKVKNVHTFN